MTYSAAGRFTRTTGGSAPGPRDVTVRRSTSIGAAFPQPGCAECRGRGELALGTVVAMNRTMVVFNLIYVGLVVIGLVVFATIFLSTRATARAKQMNIARWKR